MLRNTMSKFLKDESGATAIEYGLIAALVSVAAIGALGAMGESLISIFDKVDSELTKASATANGEGGGDPAPAADPAP